MYVCVCLCVVHGMCMMCRLGEDSDPQKHYIYPYVYMFFSSMFSTCVTSMSVGGGGGGLCVFGGVGEWGVYFMCLMVAFSSTED